MGAFSAGTTGQPADTTKKIEKWGIETCYPFSPKDQHKAKKTSSKALIMAHAYSNVIMDKIEEAVKNGLVGNEMMIGNLNKLFFTGRSFCFSLFYSLIFIISIKSLSLLLEGA